MAEDRDQTKATRVPTPEVKETVNDVVNQHAADGKYDPCITTDDPYGNTME